MKWDLASHFECGGRGPVIHEILHALGRPHEHQRHDRDGYITVHWGNVEPGKERWLQKLSHHRYVAPYSAYDYRSVMHYGPRANGVGTRITMSAKVPPAPPGQRLGYTDELTPLDVSTVNFLVDVARRHDPGYRYWEDSPFGTPRSPGDGPFGIY